MTVYLTPTINKQSYHFSCCQSQVLRMVKTRAMASSSKGAEQNVAPNVSASPGESSSPAAPPAHKWVRYNGGRATEVPHEGVRNVDGLIKAAYKEFRLDWKGVAPCDVALYPHGRDGTTTAAAYDAWKTMSELGDAGNDGPTCLELVGPDVSGTGGGAQAGGAGAYAISSHPVRVT